VRGERSSAAYTEPDELAGVLARRRAQALPLPVERAARECERPAGLERVERAAHGAGVAFAERDDLHALGAEVGGAQRDRARGKLHEADAFVERGPDVAEQVGEVGARIALGVQERAEERGRVAAPAQVLGGED